MFGVLLWLCTVAPFSQYISLTMQKGRTCFWGNCIPRDMVGHFLKRLIRFCIAPCADKRKYEDMSNMGLRVRLQAECTLPGCHVNPPICGLTSLASLGISFFAS